MARELYGMIERDEDGIFVGEGPEFKACYAHGRTIDEFIANMREFIELCTEYCKDSPSHVCRE